MTHVSLLRRAPESRQDERIKYGLNARKLCARNTGARPYENEIIMRVKNDFGGRRRRIWARRASRETCIIMALVRYDEESGYVPASPLANDAAAADYVVRRDKSASSALPRHRLGRSAQRTVSATRSAVRAKIPLEKHPSSRLLNVRLLAGNTDNPPPRKCKIQMNRPQQNGTDFDPEETNSIRPGSIWKLRLLSDRVQSRVFTQLRRPSNFFALCHTATVDRPLPGVRRLYTTICRL